MIWFTLALFVVSFLITALLAPKPKFEDARPQQLKDVSFPRATEDAPIPLILGKVRMDAPNTIWYGDFESRPIREKVKTGLFSSTRVTVGFQYYLGLHLALGMGPGTILREIFMDDKSVWTGSTSGTVPTAININQPSLWGGYKEGGGWTSSGTYYPGSFDPAVQVPDPYIISQVGAGNVPAYTGTAHIVFNKAYIGEQANLRKMAFVLENYTNALSLPNSGKVGEDMNPAEAIYQIMTDTWRGMGINPADIDVVTLQTIGITLHSEGNGCSVVVTAESTGASLIQEILRQIDGIAFQDPETGRIAFKLIRNDYVVGSLPIYDENDIIKVRNFSRTGWEEVIAQVKVSFPQRDRESDAVAISQDMATVQMIGRLRSTTVSFPFCYDKTLANNLASRERAQLSVPLFRMTLEMNRNANTLRPGDVFRLDWADYGLENLVMRVQKFDMGELLDGRIVVDCLQDSFSLATVVFAPPNDSGWIEPQVNPVNIAIREVVEMPHFFSSRLEFPLPDGSVGYIPLCYKPSAQSTGFTFLHGDVSGDLDIREPTDVAYAGSGQLALAYSNTAGLGNGRDGSVGLSITGAGSSAFDPTWTVGEIRSGNGGLLYMNGEWLAYENAVDGGGGNWTLTGIHRGLLGTRPLTHPVNTRIYQFRPDFLTLGTLDTLVEGGDNLFYKLLDHAGRRSQDASEVSQTTIVTPATGAANRPLRPRLLQMDGQRTALSVTTVVDRTLTWRASNRKADQIALEDSSAETPDLAETYDVDVMIGGVRNATLSAVGVTSPYTVPFSSVVLVNANCEFRVTSRRTVGDLRSSATYGWLPFTINQDGPVVAAVGAQTIDEGVTSINVAYPSGVAAGNLLVLPVMHRSVLTVPTGWTLLSETAVFGGFNQKVAVLIKTADGSESGSLTLNQSVANRFIGQMLRVSGSFGTPTATNGTRPSEAVNDGVDTVAVNTAAAALMITCLSTSLANTAPTVTTCSVEGGWTLVSPASIASNRLGIAHRTVSGAFSDGGVTFTFNVAGGSETGSVAVIIPFV